MKNLTQALNAAVAGLKANQTGMSVIAANVANAETPGYVRKSPILVTTAAGNSGIGVRVAGVNREVDQYVQRQYRVELSGANYADLRAQFYNRLQDVYGVPGSDSSLQSIYDNFTTALQGLTTTPDSSSARSSVLSAAQVLTQQLNSMSGSIQGLRSDAESGLSDAVTQANEAMKRIADINQQLGTTSNNSDGEAATLQDQRDQYINQLAQLMDITVVPTDQNQVNVFTNSGIQLVGTQASTLAFDAKGSITPQAQWSADPTQRGVGTIQLVGPNGGNVDLIASNSIRSGTIAAYIEMRDKVLPQAQSQIDAIAAGMASALSDKTVNGTPAIPVGAQNGFDIDLGNLLAGNSVGISYTDTATNITKTLTSVRVDDPRALPLSNTATADPNDQVVGINVAGGMASVVNQLNALFSLKGLQFSNPSGSTLEILDDGVLNTVNVNSVSANVTVTSLTSGGSQLPFFTDGFTPYSGAITSTGSQSLGLAGRIAVNASLLADPSKLVQTSAATAAGDPTRPNFIYNQLFNTAVTFSPQSGIGTNTAPFSGSLPTFIRQVLSQQGEAASNADSLKQGQDVVLNSLQQRLNDNSSVNVDSEMANLLQLQNSYAANARVMTTVRDMFQMLMQM